MKYLYFLLLFVFIPLNSVLAQTQVFFDDFESYTVGEKLVNQSTTNDWTTWNHTKGQANDPYIVNAQAFSGTKSVNIVTNNDLVLLLNNKETGRYKAEFHIMINSNFGAYFNMLQHFDGSNSKWGMQMFFNDNGTGYIDAGAEKAAEFNFQQGQWINIKAIIDLDDDFATMYIDDNESVSWKWSSGSFGTDSIDKLDAINFYGWTNDTTKIGSDFFIDDVKISKLTVPNAPINLVAIVDSLNVSLSWDAPKIPAESYLIMRNGEVIARGITKTSYVDNNLYPNQYTYSVRAQYNGLGYSHSSKKVMATISGSVDRNMVLFEINTGTWCQYCPGAAMGADDMKKNGLNVAIIEYHNKDNYTTTDCTTRENYYAITGFPTTHVDGLKLNVGGSSTETIYPSYLLFYNKRKDIPSINLLDLQISQSQKDKYKATVTIKQKSNYFNSGLRLRTALTESHIQKYWQNQSELNFVCRKMYPNAIGTNIDFSESSIQNYEFEFTLNKLNGFVKNNCEFIAFIQYDPTKEVVQTAKVDMATIVSNVEEYTQHKILISPNPANEYIKLQTNGVGQVQIFNSVGQLLLKKKINNINEYIDIKNFTMGMYIVKIISRNNVYYKRLLVQ